MEPGLESCSLFTSLFLLHQQEHPGGALAVMSVAKPKSAACPPRRPIYLFDLFAAIPSSSCIFYRESIQQELPLLLGAETLADLIRGEKEQDDSGIASTAKSRMQVHFQGFARAISRGAAVGYRGRLVPSGLILSDYPSR